MLNKPVEVDISLPMSNQLWNYRQLHTGFILFLWHIAECSDPENPENKCNFDSANVISALWCGVCFVLFCWFVCFSIILGAESGS